MGGLPGLDHVANFKFLLSLSLDFDVVQKRLTRAPEVLNPMKAILAPDSRMEA
jgi:hypothetical protein